MSKYYDETLKAQEQKPRASESSPVDVVSLVDAIKHATPGDCKCGFKCSEGSPPYAVAKCQRSEWGTA